MTFFTKCAFALLAATSIVAPAHAAQVFSTGYDTPNGDGNAAGGTFNYWDKSYSGAGSTTTDGAALTGGSGDLTDGVIAADFWYNLENNAGTGPYVGWRDFYTTNPLLTFHFGGSTVISDINLHIDNSGLGGVFSPTAILIDGVSQAFTGPALGSIGWASITGLNLTGSSHTIQLNQVSAGNWVFVSEVTFAGTAVPEPATWAMMIMGFGMVGAGMRRRATKVSYA
jgi:PEP-CTERM motif